MFTKTVVEIFNESRKEERLFNYFASAEIKELAVLCNVSKSFIKKCSYKWILGRIGDYKYYYKNLGYRGALTDEERDLRLKQLFKYEERIKIAFTD